MTRYIQPCKNCASEEWNSLCDGICDRCRGCVTPEDIKDMESAFDILYSRLVDADNATKGMRLNAKEVRLLHNALRS